MLIGTVSTLAYRTDGMWFYVVWETHVSLSFYITAVGERFGEIYIKFCTFCTTLTCFCVTVVLKSGNNISLSYRDYCNAVLYGVHAKVTRRLQAVLHAAARLITGVCRNQHITATLRDTLHWLPVLQRILFKVALMAFDCVRGQGPGYFDDVLVPFHTVRACIAHDCNLPITVTWSSRVMHSSSRSA